MTAPLPHPVEADDWLAAVTGTVDVRYVRPGYYRLTDTRTGERYVSTRCARDELYDLYLVEPEVKCIREPWWSEAEDAARWLERREFE